ncbi:MAG: choice-of-anchor J domain-containing protein [Gelidibacter sp.]
MKKIIYVLAIAGALFTGCNPLDDINKDADAQEHPVVGNAEYTLTDDDYDALDLSFGSFNSEDEAKQLIPGLLADTYPFSFWGQGSSVLVGYNLYIGAAEGVSDYTGATVYNLTNADYASTGSDAFGFYPNVNAASQIPDVLDAQIASPTEGQIVLAKYKQYVDTPEVGLANIVEYNFAGSFAGWNIVEESGANDVWTSQSGYVQGNGYFGGQVANAEWLVSPSIDLSGDSNLKFQITHAIKYATDLSLLKILVSTDYTGDTSTATWNEITLMTPAGVDTLDPSEDYDFSAYDGQTINIAFRYESTNSDAGRWRISNVAIKTLGATGQTNSKGAYFKYTGGVWEAVDGVYYLSSADYDSMGTGSGQPGQYNNFSSSISPNNYLPTFMALKFPYGQNDEEKFIIYDYYSSSSGAQMRGNLYTVIDGVWTAHESTIATTLQFGFDNGVWVPDNTIRYTLTNADYEYIGNTLASDPDYSGLTATLINYHDYDYNWSDEQIIYSLGVFLDNYDPTAAEGQKYQITYLKYDSGIQELTANLIKTGGVWVAN